jgi:peptidylprolyl isomerase/peptidyl-prolyl cis-trans isomerase B (cyclophilin B)
MRRAGHASALALALVLAACTPTPSPTSALAGCPTAAPTVGAAKRILADAGRAVVGTSLGTFTIRLDARSAPIATANFVALARCGFYGQISFHRVLAGFLAQAGDPATRSDHGDFPGVGNGGPGYHFEVEFPADDQPYDRYAVAMANALQFDPASGQITGGTETNGSQFFIALESLAGQLRRYYSFIGRVVEGTEVVDAIGRSAVDDPSHGLPLEPIVIESVTIQKGS